jgi:hypothetical protein
MFLLILEEQMIDAENTAYLKAGHNAYFGNGFKAGVEFALEQINKNVAKSNVKLCSLCGAIFKPHEQNPNDAICKDCHSKLRGY